MKEALKRGQALAMGIDHPNCVVSVDKVTEAVRQSLMNDLVL
jgi:hypothetical protein